MAATRNLDYFTTFLDVMEKGRRGPVDAGDAILRFLRDRPIPVGELLRLTSTSTATSSSNFVDYLGKFESLGLIHRTMSEGTAVYELTPQGREAAAAL